MSTRHIAAEDARLHDLTPEGSSRTASKRFRQKLAADGFTVDKGFALKPGYLYTVVRAISARVNQNYDGWPSDELKKSYKTFIGKPVFVNHENHDPTKARGVVVAARYVENGMDKYIEVVQEIDAGRFPKLAHEIKTGGLDSVSMGAEAGFTICSYCHNKATDMDDMCDHVRHHKGKTLRRFDKRTGNKEDVLVFESCHKISFFELSYVFEPADETAVASKVVVAGLNKSAVDFRHDPRREGESEEEWFNRLIQPSPGQHGEPLSEPRPKPPKAWDYTHHESMPWLQPDGFSWHPHFVDWYTDTFDKHPDRAGSEGKGSLMDGQGFNGATVPGAATQYIKHLEAGGEPWNPDEDLFDPRQFGASHRTAGDDLAVPAPPGTKTIDQSVIDSTPVVNLTPATELTGHEAPGLPKSSAFDGDIAEITKLAGECPPGMDCSRNLAQGEQIFKDSPNNPVNQESSDPNGTGGISPKNVGTPSGGTPAMNDNRLLPGTQALNDALKKQFPDLEIGGYREDPAYPDEHPAGKALDLMTKDLEVGNAALPVGWSNGADYAIWQNKMHYPDGSTKPYTGPNPHTDHVHFHHPGTAPTQRAAGKYTKEDFNHPSGLKPWERDKASDTEDAAAIEIESMLLTAGASEDYWEWKAEHGEEADREHGVGHAPENRSLRDWVQQVTKRTAETITNPEHSQDTTRHNTITTYLASHAFLNGQGAPVGHSLDFGAGWGDSATHPELNADGANFHTLEPHPNKGMVPDFRSPSDIDDGTYSRLHSLNVLNVAERGARDDAVRHIGRILAPGGHAVITTRGRREIEDMLKVTRRDGEFAHQPGPDSDPGSVIVDGNSPDPNVRKRYQKGFTPDELHQYVSSILGDGYTVRKVKVGSAPAAVHIIRNADNVPAQPPRPIAEQVEAARRQRSAAVKKIARQRALKLAWGETEAPIAVNTLREEGSAPEDDNNDMEQYVDKPDFENTIPSPEELSDPDLSQAAQIDRQQEMDGASPDVMGGQPGPASMQPPAMGGGAPQQQFMTLQIPIPGAEAPAAASPAPAQPSAAQLAPEGQPMPVTASLLDYFDTYFGRRVANWLDAIEANRAFTPEEAADYRRQTAMLSTLENGRELSTTNRNPGKEPANMARNTIASRNKVARAGRRQHFAEGPLVDGGPYGRNDEGEQEEAFISQTPPAEAGDYVTDGTNIPNTEHNLVARVQAGREQLLRDAQALASLRKRALTEAGGPVAEVVDPTVNTGPEGEALTGDDFVSANPNDGVKPTNPHDASLRAFQAFDGWLAQKTGKSSRRHSEASIKKAAAQFSREAGISPQALFPALGIVLREARKNDKQANTKGAKMRKRSNESLDVAAPDGRVDVEAPVENVTSAEAQASQFDIHDFGNNAGDNVAKPDLSTDQNWAPGEASGQKAAAIKTAGGLLAMRCAEGMIAAGLEPNDRERKYQLAAEFEKMNRGLIQDRVALLERFAAVRDADRRKVASGSSRGAARSPIPAGLGGGTRTAAAGPRVAAHDPRNDSSLFI